MIGKFFILLSLCFLFHGASAFGQQKDHGPAYFRHIKLKKIPISVEEPFLVRQFYPDSPDSLVHADRFFFENVTIGKIKSCKLDYAMRNDTVQSITIFLTGQKNYDAARKQAQKEFGPAVFILIGNAELLSWIPKNLHHDIQVSLQRKNKEWGSEMIIQSANN